MSAYEFPDVDAAIAASEAGQVRDGDSAGGVLGGTYPNPSFAADMATQAELDAHIADSSAAHAASAVSADSTTLVGTGTDVQAVLEELDNGIADHLADATAAHAASAISFTPAGTIAATDVQAAIAEVASEASPWEQIINKDGSTLTGFTQDSGSWVSSGGVISVDSTGGTARLACDTAYQNGNMIFKYDQRILSDGIVNNSRGGGLWNWDGSGAGAPHARFLYNTGGSERVDLEADSTTAVQNQDFAWTPDTWYTVTIIGAGQWFQVLVDGVFIVAGTIGHNGVASVGFKAGFQVTSAKADFRNMKLWVPALPS